MSRDRKSLKQFVLDGSIWTIGGYGVGQLIRFARSLVLTRLMLPDAFGQMALVWAVMYGLEMLSDIGVGAAVIRDKRGDDPDFLNTAWTLQVIRGGGLWLVACALAYPMAHFYDNPELLQLIPITGLNALIAGFSSTSVYTSSRQMAYGRVTVLNLLNEVLACVVVVGWAYFSPTVWALVGGALVGRLFLTVGTHIYLPGIKNQFRWDQSSFSVLMRFGKWIFFSSALYICYVQGDRLMLGKFLSLEQLGVYSVAIMLSEAVNSLTNKFSHSVLYPAFSRTVNEAPHRLVSVVDKSRLGIDATIVLPIGILALIGSQLVGVLYDSRYTDAGWILQILCVRLLMSAILTSSEVCLFSLGHAHYATLQNAARVIWIFTGIPIGWHFFGFPGAVWAVSLTELPVAAVIWIGLYRHKMFSLLREMRSVGFALCGGLIGWVLHEAIARLLQTT